MAGRDRSEPRAATAAEAVAQAARDLLGGSAEAQPFLQGWPVLAETRGVASMHLPVLAWLDEAALPAVPSTRPIVETMTAAVGALAWRQSYKAADFGPAFLQRYGWTELIGLRGPIPSTTMACGILMLGPNTDYPAHAHEAEELYLPLAGSARWMRDRGDHMEVAPGQTIHHPSWMVHGMRTGSEPLLALYVWRNGDLAAKPLVIDPLMTCPTELHSP